VQVRVFSEQDIPIQVALGQYDLGITGRAWVDELVTRFGHDSIVMLRSLDVGGQRLVAAAAAGCGIEELASRSPRVATEFPSLTARYLNRLRVPGYRLIEVWGNAHAWPPDDADLAVVSMSENADGDARLRAEGLEAVAELHRGSACVIANRRALSECDLRAALEPLLRLPGGEDEGGPISPLPLAIRGSRRASTPERTTLRVALPDGHAQRHTVEALAEAGLRFEGYDAERAVRRPVSGIDGVEVKVIRPQDMPQAVALGLFDLAMTGRDWLAAHKAAFPLSPVEELVDLRRSRYKLGAVVSEDLPGDSIEDAVAYWRRDDPRRPIRVASEYAALADHYARDRHLGRYRVLPIAGASEGFVPEDADILIEGSETGTTLRANRLRMIDVIMESTNCVIGSTSRPAGRRGELRDELVERLRAGAERV
jgi:ATP phosphoribosyltransferase